MEWYWITLIGWLVLAVIYAAFCALKQIIVAKEATATGAALVIEKLAVTILGIVAWPFETLVGILVHLFVADHPATASKS